MESRSKHSRTHDSVWDTMRDSILAMMRTHHIPLTRENYLQMYFAPGEVPERIHPEIEASFPEIFREIYPTVEEVELAKSLKPLKPFSWFCSVCGVQHTNTDDADCPCSQWERSLNDGTACAAVADRLFLRACGIRWEGQ